MSFFDNTLDRLGRRLARIIQKEVSGYAPFTPSDPETLGRYLQPADVLLIEGNQKLSTAIKYLTQSTWSHAAFYVGNALSPPEDGGEPKVLIEADLTKGVIAVPLSTYRHFNTRICRPVRLADEDQRKVVSFMVERLGLQYDLKNVIDLLRYLLPTPPVPTPWRRRMLALGSGDPTRAICSTLVAQAFQSVHYPILPEIRDVASYDENHRQIVREILHIRHYSLFTPRDFDLSPYFEVVKPSIETGFDYRQLNWYEDPPEQG